MCASSMVNTLGLCSDMYCREGGGRNSSKESPTVNDPLSNITFTP